MSTHESSSAISNEVIRLRAQNEGLRVAVQYLLEYGNIWRLRSSGDCGDHCANSCPWCTARAALEQK